MSRVPSMPSAAARTASEVARDLDAAGLAAAAGMDLRLDDPDRTAQRFRGGHCFIWRPGHAARGYRNAKTPENIFRLIFVQIHRVVLRVL